MGLLLLFFLLGTVAANRDDPLPAEAVSIKESDILIWNEKSPTGMQASALRATDKKWPNAKVPVKFDHSISTDEQKIIAEAMAEIHQKTCVRFHNAVGSNHDYVLIVKPLDRTCSSFVGRQSGKQQLNLGAGCYSRGTILHELMHALGFVHEHNRADRDDYVSINWDTIREKSKHNFQKYSSRDLTLMDTGYSYNSIMHYEGDAFSKDGSATIIPKSEATIGGGNGLSNIDILRINRYYGCPGTGLEITPKPVLHTTPEPTRPTVPPKSEKDLSAEVGGRRMLKSIHGTYLRAGLYENKVDLVSRADDWEHWYVEDHLGKVVFKAIHSPGRFIRGNPEGHVDLVFHSPQDWEMWTPFKNDNGSWSFRSHHYKWLSAREDGSVRTVDRRGSWEHFWVTSW